MGKASFVWNEFGGSEEFEITFEGRTSTQHIHKCLDLVGPFEDKIWRRQVAAYNFKLYLLVNGKMSQVVPSRSYLHKVSSF